MRRASPCRDPEYWAHSAKEFWLNPRQSSLLGLKIVWAKEANRNCRLRHQFQVRICLDSIFIRWTSILRSSWDSLKESQDCKAQSSNLNLNDKCCQSEKYFRICTIFFTNDHHKTHHGLGVFPMTLPTGGLRRTAARHWFFPPSERFWCSWSSPDGCRLKIGVRKRFVDHDSGALKYRIHRFFFLNCFPYRKRHLKVLLS